MASASRFIEGQNQNRRWRRWHKFFELVMDFEGITDDSPPAASKRRAVLLTGWWKKTERTVSILQQTFRIKYKMVHK